MEPLSIPELLAACEDCWDVPPAATADKPARCPHCRTLHTSGSAGENMPCPCCYRAMIAAVRAQRDAAARADALEWRVAHGGKLLRPATPRELVPRRSRVLTAFDLRDDARRRGRTPAGE